MFACWRKYTETLQGTVRVMVYVGTCPEHPFTKTSLFIKDTVRGCATMSRAYVLNQGRALSHPSSLPSLH